MLVQFQSQNRWMRFIQVTLTVRVYKSNRETNAAPSLVLNSKYFLHIVKQIQSFRQFIWHLLKRPTRKHLNKVMSCKAVSWTRASWKETNTCIKIKQLVVLGKQKLVTLNRSSGVTRVKGQPGQLTNKQLSRRSWVGGEPLTALETHHGSFLDFHLNLCISRHMISEMTLYSVLYTVFWYFVKILNYLV